MAQRVHGCPQCGGPVEVPDNYFHKLINCPACGAVLDRRSGEAAGATQEAQPGPVASAQAPSTFQNTGPQAHSSPNPYPGHNPQAYPGSFYPSPAPAKRGFPRWAIGLIVGVGALVLAVVGLSVWATGKIKEATSAPPTSEWVTYKDPSGQFTARFPREPEVDTQHLGNGIVSTDLICRIGPHAWNIGYFDLSNDYNFDSEAGMREFARQEGGRMKIIHRKDHLGFPGLYGEIDDGRIKVRLFRTPSRVWIVAVREHRDDFDYFLDNLKLSDAAMGIRPFQLQGVPEFRMYEGVPLERLPSPFFGFDGRPPYAYTVEGEIPPGMEIELPGEGRGSNSELTGTPSKAGTYTVTVKGTDADEREAETEVTFIVQAIPDRIAHFTSQSVQITHNKDDDSFEYNCEVGIGRPLSASMRAVSDVPGKVVVLSSAALVEEDSPEWLAFTSNDQFLQFVGVPTSTGPVQVGVEVEFAIPGTEISRSVEFVLSIDVQPVPEDALKYFHREYGVRKIVSTPGVFTEATFRYEPSRPSGWPWNREWKTSIEWDLEGVDLPETMKVEIRETPQGVPQAYLSGYSDKTGTWEFDLVIKVDILYVEETVEVTQPVSVQINAIAERELPTSLRLPIDDWEVTESVEYPIRRLAPLLDLKLTHWNRRRVFELEGEWLIEDIEMPPGLYLETEELEDNRMPLLYIKGQPEKTGTWEFEIKGTVRVTYIEEPIEIVRKVKLTIE